MTDAEKQARKLLDPHTSRVAFRRADLGGITVETSMVDYWGAVKVVTGLIDREISPEPMTDTPHPLTEDLARWLCDRALTHYPSTHLTWDDTDQDYWRREAAALLASPIFQRVERYGRREGWAEGFDAAERDLMEHDRHEWDNDCIPNPYTVEGTDPLAALKANPASRDSALRGDHD